jgi:hypothetical protein
MAAVSLVLLVGCLPRDGGGTVPVTVAPPPVRPVAPASAPLIPPAPPQVLSPRVAEIARLARAGLGESVMLAYLNQSPAADRPTADEIIYLNDLGVPPNVLTALLAAPASPQTPADAPSLTTTPVESTPVPEISVTAHPAPESLPPPDAEITAGPPPDQIPAEAPGQDLTVVNYFYTALDPFGSWFQSPDYGWCWRPTVAVQNRLWRPYSDAGRWLYTDHGWYWQSDYSWGWAPFHYGRWYLDTARGWCWVPEAVWAPSWVTWRHSQHYCGWAPLPPAARWRVGHGFVAHGGSHFSLHALGLHPRHYTFVPYHRFCDRSPAGFALTYTHTHAIFHETIIVHNYFSGPRHIVINKGFPHEHVREVTGQRPPTVAVRDLPRHARPDQVQHEGDQPVVYRPTLAQLPLAHASPSTDRARHEPRKPSGMATTASPAPPPVTGGISSSSLSPEAATTAAATSPASGTRPGGPVVVPLQQASEHRARQEAVKPAALSPSGAARTGVHGIRPAPGIEQPAVPQPLTSVPAVPGVATRPLSPPQPITSTPAVPGYNQRPLSPPQAITSVPQQPGVNTRPLRAPEPLRSVPTVPSVETRPFTAPQPVTVAPPAPVVEERSVRRPGRYEPSRTAEPVNVPRWEQTARSMQQNQPVRITPPPQREQIIIQQRAAPVPAAPIARPAPAAPVPSAAPSIRSAPPEPASRPAVPAGSPVKRLEERR